MKRVALGNTGLTVAPLVFGTLPMGPLQAGLTSGDGGRLVRYGLDRGINLLDTAELYQTYGHIRAGLEGYGGEVYVATKTHAPTAELARAHVERALRELRRERLDIVHMHAARLPDPVAVRPAVFEELLRLKAEGKIRNVGVSSHCVSAIRKAAATPEFDVVHPLINRHGLGILDGTAEEMAEAILQAAAAGKGVYAMKALGGGNFIAEARQGLRYVRCVAGIQAVAVGMLSEGETGANVALFADGREEEEVWAPLESRRRRLRIMEGFCKGCGACVDACASDALTIADGKAAVDEARCVLCGYCAAACPEFAIRVV